MMSDMREKLEKWCAKNEANPNNYYFSEGWKACWHTRDAEIEASTEELTQCRKLLDSYGFHQVGIHNGIMAMNNRIQKLESDVRLFKLDRSEIEAMQAKHAALVEALIKYGKHINGCTYGIPQPRFCENPCTCGLREVINAAIRE